MAAVMSAQTGTTATTPATSIDTGHTTRSNPSSTLDSPRTTTKRPPSTSQHPRNSIHSTSSHSSASLQTSHLQDPQSTTTLSPRTSLRRPHSIAQSSTASTLHHLHLATNTVIRDFGYPLGHQLFHGPPPEPEGVATPGSESNRHSWGSESSRNSWHGAQTSSGFGANAGSGADVAWLPSQAYHNDSASSAHAIGNNNHDDGGPPYSEDEDLQSPVISGFGGRHRKQNSNSVGFDSVRRGSASSSTSSGRERRGANAGQLDGAGAAAARNGRRRRGLAGDGVDADGRRVSRTAVPRRSFHEGETYSSGEDAVDDEGDGRFSDGESDGDGRAYRASGGSARRNAAGGADVDGDEVDDEGEPGSRHSMTYTFSITSPDEEVTGKAVSLYNFERENDNELPLAEGQIILVSYRLSQGWLVAQDPRTGESGLVPESYVRLFRDLEGWDGEGEGENGEAGVGAVAPADAEEGGAGQVQLAEQSVDGGPGAKSSSEQADGVKLPDGNAGQIVEEDRGPISPSQKPAVISTTFSTSRDDLGLRKDLLAKNESLERRGSLDKRR